MGRLCGFAMAPVETAKSGLSAIGGPRTHGLLLPKQALCQLSCNGITKAADVCQTICGHRIYRAQPPARRLAGEKGLRSALAFATLPCSVDDVCPIPRSRPPGVCCAGLTHFFDSTSIAQVKRTKRTTLFYPLDSHRQTAIRQPSEVLPPPMYRAAWPQVMPSTKRQIIAWRTRESSTPAMYRSKRLRS